MKPVESLEALATAKDKILEAERALDAALLAMESAPRADKMLVNDAVGQAFAKLRSARAILTDIEKT